MKPALKAQAFSPLQTETTLLCLKVPGLRPLVLLLGVAIRRVRSNVGIVLRGEKREVLEKKLSRCHVHYTDLLVIEPLPPEIRHGPST
jgi:hypothetical protein